MSKEGEGQAIPLSAIYINIKERSLTLEAEDQTTIRLSWSPRGLLYELLPAAGEAASSPALALTERAVEPVADATQEKEPTVTLTGRLKSQPKPGRPDAKGHPTAWARFAAHEEGHDSPHLYSATFHRHTAKIVLSLANDAQITVQGYPHLVADPSRRRLDTLSVINLVSYPGKREKT